MAQKKSLTVPAASWHNWDGLAINTVFNTVEHITGEELGGGPKHRPEQLRCILGLEPGRHPHTGHHRRPATTLLGGL